MMQSFEKQVKSMNSDEMNYPVPDPDWDYAHLWSDVWELKQEIEKLVKTVQSTETATGESNSQMIVSLQKIYDLRQQALYKLIEGKD